MTHRLPLALSAALLLAATGGPSADRGGYLAAGAFDILQVLPPAPTPGDARAEADRRIFKATRAMIGSPRYRLATHDAEGDEAALMADFGCAIGVTLTPQNAPATKILADRALDDTGAQVGRAKAFYRRERPFRIDSGAICQPVSELDRYDYPSGHTNAGWTWGLVLADLVPARAAGFEARARAFGESRYICGAHNFSAVEGGQFTASATMAAVRATPAYQADATTARAEVQALLADPHAPKPTGCDAEAKLVSAHGL